MEGGGMKGRQSIRMVDVKHLERVCRSAALMIGHLPSVVEIERSTKSLPDLNGTKCNS
ncbi:hypothetical protein T10_800 [Trichinella papuae]|uniref:Uncharacterized protein n=1 Tax=Trichinella papuae TaxID=268474 RepID=A0A0V1MXN7_9BILA|nr:hypothetical protein T10_800 [Trichinella papuae]